MSRQKAIRHDAHDEWLFTYFSVIDRGTSARDTSSYDVTVSPSLVLDV